MGASYSGPSVPPAARCETPMPYHAILPRRRGFPADAPRNSKFFSAPAVKKGNHVRRSTCKRFSRYVRRRRHREPHDRLHVGGQKAKPAACVVSRECRHAPDPIGAQEGSVHVRSISDLSSDPHDERATLLRKTIFEDGGRRLCTRLGASQTPLRQARPASRLSPSKE
jgi:hypothetical protein